MDIKRLTEAVIVVVLAVLALSVGVISATEAGNELETKKILMVIAPEGFDEKQLSEPKQVFEAAGAEVVIASKSKEAASGMSGDEVKPDISFYDVNPGDYDVIVIVGGTGSKRHLWEDEDLHALVKEAYEKGKVVSAIGLSPVVLAKAGILEDKKCTGFRTVLKVVGLYGATYVDEGVVISDRIVTGRDSEAANEFANAIIGVTQKSRLPGFEAIVAVAGLLAVGYVLRRRR